MNEKKPSIWITGDCHADFRKFTTMAFPEQKGMTKEDVVIICGDFGGVWAQEDGPYIGKENYWLDWLNERPFTTVFVDGNHENFFRLTAFPEKEWKGGKVHQIRNSVYHLMRGEVYDINEKRIFTFGGASSHDISDGLVDSADEDWRKQCRALEKEGKYMFRIKGLSWWEEELPSEAEMQNGIANLEKVNWKVDYIVTHSPAASIIAILGHGLYKQDILTKYLEEIRQKTEYKRMFSGHMHVDKQMNATDILLYDQIIQIG